LTNCSVCISHHKQSYRYIHSTVCTGLLPLCVTQHTKGRKRHFGVL